MADLVFFDVDGVLIDSMPQVHEATCAVFRAAGVEPLPTFEDYVEHFDSRNGQTFFRSRGVHKSDEFLWRHFMAYVEATHAPVFRDAHKVVSGLVKKGKTLALVSANRSEGKILSTLRKARLLDYFPYRGLGIRHKAPFMREVLSKTGVAKDRAAMIGDSPSDHFDAHEAGVETRIGVGRYAPSERALRRAPVTHVVDSLSAAFSILTR